MTREVSWSLLTSVKFAAPSYGTPSHLEVNFTLICKEQLTSHAVRDKYFAYVRKCHFYFSREERNMTFATRGCQSNFRKCTSIRITDSTSLDKHLSWPTALMIVEQLTP